MIGLTIDNIGYVSILSMVSLNLNPYSSEDSCMSHKESMEMPLTARNVVRDLIHTRRLRAKASYVLEAFASVKSSEKKGLPGILRLVMLARLP